MGARAELLKTEIGKAREDLALHLRDLKVEAKSVQRKAVSRVLLIGGIAVAALVTIKLARHFLRRD